MKMFSHPEIETKRLRLRWMTDSDYDALHDIRFNDEVLQYIAREKENDKTRIKSFIEDRLEDIKNGILCYWGICLKDNSNLMGTICLWNIDRDNNVAEIGYELHPDSHGQGFMSEAFSAVLNYGFEAVKFIRIDAFTHRDNTNSIRLLKRFGFVLNTKRIDTDIEENLIFEKRNA